MTLKSLGTTGVYELDRQSQLCRRVCHCLKLQNQPFSFSRPFGTACIFWTEASACSHALDRFFADLDQAGMKIITKNT